jgi:hypothetical protein
LLLLQNDRTHEVGHWVVALQQCISFVSNVFPEAAPLVGFGPNVSPLIEGHTVLPTILKDLLNGKWI